MNKPIKDELARLGAVVIAKNSIAKEKRERTVLLLHPSNMWVFCLAKSEKLLKACTWNLKMQMGKGIQNPSTITHVQSQQSADQPH
jgi:predicted nucleotide-binding protein (sugar kinase/HSP70/actin superfamily)